MKCSTITYFYILVLAYSLPYCRALVLCTGPLPGSVGAPGAGQCGSLAAGLISIPNGKDNYYYWKDLCYANSVCAGYVYGSASCPNGPSYQCSIPRACTGCQCVTNYININNFCCIVNCPAGTYKTGCVTCTPCPAGTWSNTVGAFQISNCTACLAGTYTATAGSTTPTICPAGTYSNYSGMSFCFKCSTASYPTQTGANSSDVCTICQPGTFFTTTQTLTACYECPAGTYSNISGALKCYNCERGSFTNTSTRTTCESCAPMQYSFTAYTQCFDCIPGSLCCYPGEYMVITSSTTGCFKCAAGSYGLGNDTQCILCPAGTTNHLIGLS
jgi:hypothetical protein